MVDFYKTSDEALDEIQTKSKKSALGIPPREIRGQLNNIPKQSYGITDVQRQNKIFVDSIGTSRQQEEKDKYQTMREDYLSSIKQEKETNVSVDNKLVSSPKSISDFFTKKTVSFSELYPSKPEVNQYQKLQPALQVEEEETDDFTDFGLGFQKVKNYLKAFLPSAFFSDEEDKQKIEDVYEENLKLQEKINKTGGGRFLQKFDDMWKNNDGFFNVAKKMASLVINNPKEALNLVTQEAPVVAVPLLFTPVGFGLNMLLRGGLITRSILTGSSLLAGNKVIEQGAMTISAAEGGITDEELKKVRTDSSIKATAITAVDFATFKLGARLFSNNLAKDLDIENYKVFKRDGKDFNKINSEVKEANREALLEASEKKLSKKEANDLIEQKIQAVLDKNGVNDDLIKKSNDAIQNRLNYYDKSFIAKPREITKVVGNFGLQTLGEGTGEYVGSAAIGEANLQDAVLESFIGGSVSLAEVLYQGIAGKRLNRSARVKGQQQVVEKQPFDVVKVEEDTTSPPQQETEETEVTKEEVKETKGSDFIAPFDEKFLDTFLQEKEADVYLAGHLLNLQGDEDIAGEALTDPINRMIDAHDKKFPNANLRNRVDVLMANEQRTNELFAKTFMVEKTVTEKLTEEGDVELGLDRKFLNGIGIKSLVATAQKIYPVGQQAEVKQEPEIQSEPLQDQDTTPKTTSQSLPEVKDSIAMDEARPSYKIEINPKNNKEQRTAKVGTTTRTLQLQEQTIGSNTLANVEQFKQSLISKFNTDTEGKNAVVNIAKITSDEGYIIDRFKRLFDTDLIFVTDREGDTDYGGFKIDGTNNTPHRVKGSHFVSNKTNKNTIVINIDEVGNTQKALDSALAHELSHVLEKSDIYNDLNLRELTDVFYENNQDKKNKIRTELTNAYTKQFTDSQGNVNTEELNKKIDGEMFAYMVQEVGNNSVFWENVYAEIYNRNFKGRKSGLEKFQVFIEKVLEAIKKIYDNFPGNKKQKQELEFLQTNDVYVKAVEGFVRLAGKNIEIRDITENLLTSSELKGGFDLAYKEFADPLNETEREEYVELTKDYNQLTRLFDEGKLRPEQLKTYEERKESLERQLRPFQNKIDLAKGEGVSQVLMKTYGDQILEKGETMSRKDLQDIDKRDSGFFDTMFDTKPTSTSSAEYTNEDLNNDLDKAADYLAEIDNKKISKAKIKEITDILNQIKDPKTKKILDNFDRAIAKIQTISGRSGIGNDAIKKLTKTQQELKDTRAVLQRELGRNELDRQDGAKRLNDRLNELREQLLGKKSNIGGEGLFLKLLQVFDEADISLVLDAQLKADPNRTLNQILGVTLIGKEVSSNDQAKFQKLIDDAVASESSIADEKKLKELKTAFKNNPQEVFESILLDKSGKPVLNYGNFKPDLFERVTQPFESFLHELVRDGVITYQDINNGLRRTSNTKFFIDLQKQYNNYSGIHTSFTLTEYLKKASDPDYYINNRTILRNQWFQSLYDAERKFAVLGDQVVLDALVPKGSTARDVGIKDAYKSTSTFREYKEWKRNRSKIFNRKLVLDEGLVNPADVFANTFFIKFPFSLMKKLNDKGIDSITLADLKPNKTEINKQENTVKQREEYLDQLRAYARTGKVDFVKRYFDDLAYAIAIRPKLTGKILNENISKEAATEFANYMNSRFKNKLKIAESRDERTMIRRTSQQTEEEYSIMYQNRLLEITEYFEQEGYTKDEARNAAFDYLVAQEKLETVTEQEYKSIVDRFNNEDDMSTEERKQFQNTENGSFDDDTGVTNLSEVDDGKSKAKKENSLNAERFRLKRTNGVTSTVFDNSYVFTKVKTLLDKFDNKFNINVVKNVNSLPKELRDQLGDSLTAKGLYDNRTGAVYLFSDNLESDADIEFTLFHELYGHYGLRSLLGKDFDSFLESQYKINSKFKKQVDDFITNNGLSKDEKLIAIEEVLADEIALNNSGNFVTKLIAKIVSMLDSLGMEQVATFLRNISSREVVFELARMKAREGNIEGPIGARFDLRKSDSNAENNAQQNNELTSEQERTLERYQEQLVVIRDALYRGDGTLRLDVDANEMRNLLKKELSVVRKVDKLLRRPLSYRSALTGQIINRDTKEQRIVNKIFAKNGDDSYTALYYHPTDSWYILKNNQFVQRLEGYEAAKDYMSEIAGGVTKISQRYATPYITNRGEYKIKDFYKYDTLGKKRGVIGYNLRKLYYDHVNQFAPIMDIIDNVFKTDTNVQGRGIAKALRNELFLNESRAGALLEKLKTQFVNPLITLQKEAIKLGATPEVINKFFHAEAAIERNAQINKITEGREENGSGMSDIEATRELNKYGKANSRLLTKFRIQPNTDVPAYTPQLTQMSILLDEISRRKVNYLYNTGIISFTTKKKLDSYKHYRNLSSVQRGEFKEQSPGDISIPGKFSISGSGLQRALGRAEGQVDDILINTILGAEQSLIRGSKNSVSQKVLAFFEQYQDTDRVQINPVPSFKRQINQSGYVEIVQEEEKNTNDKLYTRVNGVRYEMKFMNIEDEFQADLYRALAGQEKMPNNVLSKIVRGMRGINRWIGSLVTTYNPAFILVNGIRDTQTAFANMAADPRIGAKRAAKMMKNYKKGVRAALLYLATRSKKDSKMSAKVTQAVFGKFGIDPARDNQINSDIARIFEDFRASGAMTFYLDRINTESQMKEIRKSLGVEDESKFKQYTSKFGDSIFGLLGIVENFSSIFEIAPRFAAYYTLTQERNADGTAAFTKRDAAVYAKELTTNFNMRGADSFFRDAYIFFNPAVQGTRRLIQNFNSKEFRYIAGIFVALGLIANMLARSEEEDDEGLSQYDMLPDYKKSTSLTWSVNTLGGSIPLAYGWNVPANVGRLLYDVFFEGLHPKDFATKMAIITAESTSPMTIGFESDKGFFAKVSKTLTPTAFVPMTELYLNENRFGSPISRQKISFLPEKANAYQGFASVNPMLESLAQGLNEATGGTEYISGALDFNPAYFEHLLNSYIPGAATMLFRKIGLDARINRGEAGLRKLGYKDIILNRFRAYPSDGWYYGAIDRLKKEVEPKYNEIKSNYSTSTEDKIKFLQDNENNADVRLAQSIKVLENYLKNAKSARNKYKSAKQINPNTGIQKYVEISNRIKKVEKDLYMAVINKAFEYDKMMDSNRYKTILYGREEF